jgi:hypothetical protein
MTRRARRGALRNHLAVATGSVEALAAEGREALVRAGPVAFRRAFEAALAEREKRERFEGLARACSIACVDPCGGGADAT